MAEWINLKDYLKEHDHAYISLKDYLEDRGNVYVLFDESDLVLLSPDIALSDIRNEEVHVVTQAAFMKAGKIEAFFDDKEKNIILLEMAKGEQATTARPPISPIGNRLLYYKRDKYGYYQLQKSALLVSIDALEMQLNKLTDAFHACLEEWSVDRPTKLLPEISRLMTSIAYVNTLYDILKEMN